MYSGLTIFTKYSGALIGAHQKIDKVARKQLTHIARMNSEFPEIKDILHFEGVNGPDGIKRKSPGVNEPWHYVDPFDENDTQINDLLNDHYSSLVKALKTKNMTKAAFEAAWLAHAIVDGLTPAHHYPYEKELSKLRGGEGLETRVNYRKKVVMPGENRKAKVRNNWKMWGARGLFATHASFELGVATLIKPLTFKDSMPSPHDIDNIKKQTLVDFFNKTAREVAVLDMYDNFMKKGWTPKLAWQVRHKLGPTLIQAVSLTWYKAVYDASLEE